MSVRSAMATFRGHHVPHMNIIGRRRLWFAISVALIAISLGALLSGRLKLSLEFEGGAELRFPNRTGLTVEEVRDVLATYGRGDAEVQVVGEGDITITTEPLEELGGTRTDALLEDLGDAAGVGVDEINRTEVGPTFGGQIAEKALRALIVFLVIVTIYIALRFEWKMALAAQVALVHDLIITAGVYALVGREVTPATVIAILTILGYSLYDTVVIFDKVKENTESMAAVAKDTYSGVVNTSLNETFMRSVNTSLVVLLPILSLLLLGGDTLKDFAFALFVGVLCGTYSSVFLASPLLAVLKEREPRIAKLRSRAEARTASRPARALTAVPGGRTTAPAAEADAPRPETAARAATAATPTRSRPKPKSKRKPPAKRRRR